MITATYSPEDNKIRLYSSARLDDETFARVKEAGFKWAPRQELFVAPKWTCGREDLALELAGEIEPEQMTLAERAQMKADRLDGIADKRAVQAGAYMRAAREISQRFEFGQPILIGHHSERKARKDREKMDTAQRKANEAHAAIGYWQYRAEGVERHANYKNDPKVRARRIKTLLAELRDLQRNLNGAHKAIELWEKVTAPEQIKKYLGNDATYSYDLWSKVDRGEMTPEAAREAAMNGARRVIEGPNLRRWIQHTLNRLSYEREMLGDVPRYTGAITPTMLQMFVREHGADKPKGAKVDAELFTVECAAPLPLHIGDGKALELSGDEWRDLMQSCGYCPPEKQDAKAPILNFKADEIALKGRGCYRGAPTVETLPQIEMTKAEYKAQGDGSWVQLSACGEYRARTCSDPRDKRAYYLRGRVAVFLTDSKAHDVPQSASEKEAAE